MIAHFSSLQLSGSLCKNITQRTTEKAQRTTEKKIDSLCKKTLHRFARKRHTYDHGEKTVLRKKILHRVARRRHRGPRVSYFLGAFHFAQ